MKKYILLLTIVLSVAAVRAQQIPLYSTYYFNKFLVNPAFTGFDNEYRFFGFYRAQWTGIPGAPVTRGGSFEGSFWKDRIGAGLSVVNDNTDIVKRINAQLSYAQKIRFAKDHQITIGLSGGVFDTRIDFDKVKVTDIVDQTVLSNSQSKVTFDISVGLSYSWKKLTIGFAIPQVLNTSARYTSNLAESKFQLKRHYVATAQYEFNIKKELINITPVVLIRKGTVGKVQADDMCMFDYKHIAYLGAGYRTEYGVTVMGGVKIAKLVTVAYAYDINTNKKIKTYVGGTHEVILGFNFSNPKKNEDENAKKIAQLAKDNEALKQKVDSAQKQIDSTQQQIDSLKAIAHPDRKPEIDELNKRVDSLEGRVRELEKLKNDFKERKAGKDGKMVGSVYELDQIYFALMHLPVYLTV